MPNYKAKGLRGTWSEENLRAAAQAVAEGSSIRKAAKANRIPEKTLRHRLKSNNLIKGKLGQPPVLGWEAENKIVLHVKRLQKAGYAPTKTALRKMAFNLAEKMDIVSATHFSKETRSAGKGWLKAFLNRNSTLTIRKAQGVSKARADGMNKQEVTEYFALLERTLAEYSLLNKPANIYNVDETGLQLNNPPQHVVAAKGSKSVQARQSAEQGETMTVVACSNAEGTFLPPYIIFKGVNKQQAWLDNLPNGAELVMGGKSAYINEELFLNWLENHFIPRKSAGPCLLLLDGHGSHTNSPDILEVALQNNVHFLPSHTTHYLQPLDRAFFKPLKTYYRNAAIEFGIANPGKKLERRHFGPLLEKAWSQASTTSTGSAGFRACGVFPFSPSAIPEYAYLTDENNVDHGLERPGTSGRPNQTSKSPEIPALTRPSTSRSPQKTLKSPKCPALTPSKVLDIVSPIPIADPSQVKRKQHAQVLTTPENIANKKAKRDAKTEKQNKRENKSVFKLVRKPFKKRIAFEDGLPSSSGGEWDEDLSDDEHEVDETDFFENVCSVNVDDYVLVQFVGKVKPLYYIGIVTKCENQEVTVNFMKRGKLQFIFPQAKDESVIQMKTIKKILPPPSERRGHFTFKVIFPKTITLV